MATRIQHRGPDGEGFFFDDDAGLGLVHRRLAIIDLSHAGDQPMRSRSGRYTICYNGEIYNYPDIRRDLERRGVLFRSHSDTEVLLELFALDGVEAFSRLNGIFALAIWDAVNRELILARDGVGVKPLYVARTSSGLGFASEMKALLAIPDLDRTIDGAAATAYLTYLWSPGSRTMFKAVKKLEPGSWVGLRRDGTRREGAFYKLPAYSPSKANDHDLIAGTRQALKVAVERQMVADVEVGAFLSGGLDSSAVVAFARNMAPASRLKCFTIDYQGGAGKADEMVSDLPYARRAARALGVDLHEVRVDDSMAQDFEKLIYHLDEPEADPAALNSLYIAGLARKDGIKVLLSGTGGDDLFTGYRRHQAARMDRLWEMTPGLLRQAIEAGIGSLPARSGAMRRVIKLLGGISLPSDRRLAGLFEWMSPEASQALFERSVEADAEAARAPLMLALAEASHLPAVEKVLKLDQLFFLTDHNLNYTDKTGMAEGVEIRVPFLDPDLIAWAAGVPTHAKLRRGVTKWVLRKAMEKHLPSEIIYRPKAGFGVPLRSWLRAGMRPMMEELLSESVLRQRGLFDPKAVAGLKRRTLDGSQDGSYPILAIMSVELWCRSFVDAGPTAASQETAPILSREAN